LENGITKAKGGKITRYFCENSKKIPNQISRGSNQLEIKFHHESNLNCKLFIGKIKYWGESRWDKKCDRLPPGNFFLINFWRENYDLPWISWEIRIFCCSYPWNFFWFFGGKIYFGATNSKNNNYYSSIPWLFSLLISGAKK
jgi:hypothetical protein